MSVGPAVDRCSIVDVIGSYLDLRRSGIPYATQSSEMYSTDISQLLYAQV